ncbi:hypothetical protein JCM11251_000281 [Rhodosporidiobolus azoricus]
MLVDPLNPFEELLNNTDWIAPSEEGSKTEWSDWDDKVDKGEDNEDNEGKEDDKIPPQTGHSRPWTTLTQAKEARKRARAHRLSDANHMQATLVHDTWGNGESGRLEMVGTLGSVVKEVVEVARQLDKQGCLVQSFRTLLLETNLDGQVGVCLPHFTSAQQKWLIDTHRGLTNTDAPWGSLPPATDNQGTTAIYMGYAQNARMKNKLGLYTGKMEALDGVWSRKKQHGEREQDQPTNLYVYRFATATTGFELVNLADTAHKTLLPHQASSLSRTYLALTFNVLTTPPAVVALLESVIAHATGSWTPRPHSETITKPIAPLNLLHPLKAYWKRVHGSRALCKLEKQDGQARTVAQIPYRAVAAAVRQSALPAYLLRPEHAGTSMVNGKTILAETYSRRALKAMDTMRKKVVTRPDGKVVTALSARGAAGAEMLALTDSTNISGFVKSGCKHGNTTNNAAAKKLKLFEMDIDANINNLKVEDKRYLYSRYLADLANQLALPGRVETIENFKCGKSRDVEVIGAVTGGTVVLKLNQVALNQNLQKAQNGKLYLCAIHNGQRSTIKMQLQKKADGPLYLGRKSALPGKSRKKL